MEILLGVDKWQKKEVLLKPKDLINGHIGIVGTSGTGKTFTIRKIVSDFSKTSSNPIKFHILDVHGDIDIENASTVKFSETSNFGLNPLQINSDLDFGGVRKKIRGFINTINRTSRVLGSKQEAALSNLLIDLYSANGFYINDHRTWSLEYDPFKYRRFPKKHPTLLDLKKFTESKAKQMITGGNSKSFSKLEELNKKITSLHRENKNITKKDLENNESFIKIKEECKNLYNEYIDSIEPGSNGEDYFRYDNKDVIKSLYERISNIESVGIFKAEEPPFDKEKNIWRYNIHSLERDEQKMFIDFLLGDLFFKAKQTGEKDYIDTYIVLDEAHIFLCDDPDHIINIIAKEARKFGVGLLLASQSFSHFPEDIISNLSSKIILGIDEMYHISSSKKLGVEVKRFGYIAPRKSILVQLKKKGDTSNKYLDVLLN